MADLFLPNCAPVKLADGNWLMAGRAARAAGRLPLIPAVAISSGDKLTDRWLVVPLRADELPAGQHPETTVIAEENGLVALTRNSLKPEPFVYVSRNFGRTWSEMKQPGFSAVTSKLYAGRLSTGQYYVLFNYPRSGKDGGRNRRVLALAVTRLGELAFSRVWKVQDSASFSETAGYWQLGGASASSNPHAPRACAVPRSCQSCPRHAFSLPPSCSHDGAGFPRRDRSL